MIKWKTKSGETIDLDNYDDKQHIENILKMLTTKLGKMPWIDFPDISGSDSDGAYWADQSIINSYNRYMAERKYLQDIIQRIGAILEKINTTKHKHR